MIDWKLLSDKCSGYSTLTVTKDPDTGNILDTVYAGLRVNLSEVMAGFPIGGASGLALFVDTLVIDAPTLDARGVTILARCIDVSALQGSALPIVTPTGDSRILEFIVGSVTGGTFALTPVSKTPPPAYAIPYGQTPLQAVYYTLNSEGKIETRVTPAVADLTDLISRPWALNAFQAGFTAASLLADADDLSRQTASQMLQWIIACVRSVDAADLPGAFADLYSQAAALMVTLNVSPGYYYVPVLSSAFYKNQSEVLVAALQSYEDNLNTLAISTNISQAVKDVSATLVDVSNTELDPLNIELKQVQDNIDGLAAAIGTLGDQYFFQQIEAHSRFALLINSIQQQRIQDWLTACFKLATSIVSLGVSVGKLAAAEPSADGLADSVKGFAEASKGFYDAASALASEPGLDTSMLEQAKLLTQMQESLMTSFQTGAVLWAQALKSVKTIPVLPNSLSAVTIDPGLAWDNYVVRAKLSIATLKRDNGEGVQQPADEYLASLEILAQYGKAVNVKMITYASQLARGVVLKAQIAAATTIVERWEQLEAKAASDQEKLAALKGVLLLRSNSIKRSLLVSWTYYRNSYFYLYFQKPPYAVNMDMNAAQLKGIFASVVGWVGQLLGDNPQSQKITLPSSNVQISLKFPIVKSGQALTHGDSALLSPGTAGNGPTLTWTIPVGTDQLAGVLPNDGDVAIWITSANFFLDGVTPNQKGNVLCNISTSGSYQNGFGPPEAFNFVTKGLGKGYAYHLPDAKVYNQWDIDSQVYQMPTPFTQWTAQFASNNSGDPSTATTLRMDLVVSYRTSDSN